MEKNCLLSGILVTRITDWQTGAALDGRYNKDGGENDRRSSHMLLMLALSATSFINIYNDVCLCAWPGVVCGCCSISSASLYPHVHKVIDSLEVGDD